MIKQETIIINEINLRITYSDIGNFILKKGTDEKYEEALDLLDSLFEYEETDEPIVREEMNELL